MRTLRGEPVDRPAVSFYEIGGFKIDPLDPDPYNVYNDPSWQPLLELAEEQTDLIRMRSPRVERALEWKLDFYRNKPPWEKPEDDSMEKMEITEENGSRFIRRTLRIGGRILSSLTCRSQDIDTTWTIEHLLKDKEDLEAFLTLPDDLLSEKIDVSNLLEEDRMVGGRGIVMVDTPDPIGLAGSMFSMEDFMVIAFTEPVLFHRLLEKFANVLHRRTEIVAREFPGHLWRIFGPEIAGAPFLPTRLFEEYVVRYTGPMVEIIQRHGGFARIHCHGRMKDILPFFVQMGFDATDPIEPPPQGDIGLAKVRLEYGREMVLFGNLEICDLENMPPLQFKKVVAQSLSDGTAGEGHGFVLMPSAAPYGRTITPQTLENYRTMVRLVNNF